MANRFLAAIVISAGLLAGPSASPGKTVTLQQGAGGYDGCVTTTLWAPTGPKPKGDPDAGLLYVRGAVGRTTRRGGKNVYSETANRVLVKFSMPPKLKGGSRKLLRARLEVFVPQVRNVRMINEILCRQVTQAWSAQADWSNAAPPRRWKAPGGTMDTTTDYSNGRPGGAVDSRAFWEYDGRWFPHKYGFLQCPPRGTWLSFNVTPLAEKWLADERANHGVALHPITQADRRFANRMAIDIPSAAAADKRRRPRLVLEFAPAARGYLAGMTHALRKYCDRSPRYRFPGPFARRHELTMARNEYEPFQVLVYPLGGELKGVRFTWTDLAGPGGATIGADDLTYHCQEMVRMHPNGKTRDWYFHGKEFWVPDPLTTPRPIDLKRHVAAPFWFTVRTRPATRGGTYRGTLTVRPRNAPPQTLALTVRVWNYKIPERWNFQTMGQTCWHYIWRAYPGIDAAGRAKLKKKYLDFLLDHRFMPTEQYRDRLSPPLDDIPYCLGRGGNTIYLSGNFTGDVKSLRQRYDAVMALDRKLRDAGSLSTDERLIDMSLVYIGDETSKWDVMRKRSAGIRRACPELMIMIGGSFPRPELDGVIDIYDPQLGGSSKTYSLREDMTHLIARSRSRGERFFWYDASGPMLPYPNVQCEEPLIASRLVFWMTWKYGVTGFEYYCYAIWSHNLPDKDGRRWPDKPFTPWGWGQTNGDGMLFYPGPDGPFSSVRFENMRDGIEDWESHYVLRDYLDALKAAGPSTPAARALAAKAQRLLGVPDQVVKDLKNWTWDPAVLLAARRELGATIEAIAAFVPEKQMLAARKARKQRDLRRQRDMLKRRAAKVAAAP